jgi:L-lactate dehydrogenase complex protein LldG
MSREAILGRIRRHLGPPDQARVPSVRLAIPEMTVEDRIASFTKALEALAGKVYRAKSQADAMAYVDEAVAGRKSVSTDSGLRGQALREECATAAVGITGASYALADTGSLVMFASSEEARLVSLLPPVHIALVESARILTGLDELLTVVPLPADTSSSMVLITGPSRTADIEQILVRGVHGPGEIHVVIV